MRAEALWGSDPPSTAGPCLLNPAINTSQVRPKADAEGGAVLRFHATDRSAEGGVDDDAEGGT